MRAGAADRRDEEADDHLQVDGRFLTKKLTDLTTDEIRALEAWVENDSNQARNAVRLDAVRQFGADCRFSA
jgi:hypothetical protein